MGHSDLDPAVHERRPWNTGRTVGPKRTLRPRDIWATQFHLDEHSLPVGVNSPLFSDDFDAFLDWRQERLWQEIKKVTGLTEASDPEEAD